LSQDLTDQNIAVHYTFFYHVLSRYEDKLPTAILCFEIKPLSICPDMVTHITLVPGGGTSHVQ